MNHIFTNGIKLFSNSNKLDSSNANEELRHIYHEKQKRAVRFAFVE